MTEHSFISSGFSGQDDSAETVSRNIKMLVEQYFLSSSKFDIEQSRAPIEALHHVSSNQRHLFRDSSGKANALCRETITSLLTFGLRECVAEFLNDGELGELSRLFFDVVTNLFLILRAGERMELMMELVRGIGESVTCGKFRIQMFIGATEAAKNGSSTRFLLYVLLKLVERVSFAESSLWDTLWVCFKAYPGSGTRCLVLEYLTCVFPQSISFAIRMLNFIVVSMSEIEDLIDTHPEIDEWLKFGLENVFSFLPGEYTALAARYLVELVNMFQKIPLSKAVTQVFDFVQRILKFNRGFCKFCVGGFVKVFPIFAKNEAFVSVCRTVAENEPDFAAVLRRQYADVRTVDPNLVTALVQILPDYAVSSSQIISWPSDVFYLACSVMRSPPQAVIDQLRVRLGMKQRPDRKHLGTLIRLVPREIVGLLLSDVYPAGVVADVIEQTPNNVSLNQQEGDFMRLAKASNCPKLAALITARMWAQDGAASVRREFEDLTRVPENWKDKTFCRVAMQLTKGSGHGPENPESNEETERRNRILTSLFDSNSYDALFTLAQNPEMIQEIVKIAFRIFRSGRDREAAKAYNLLKKVPNRNEFFDLHRYRISQQIFNLARNVPECEFPGESSPLPQEQRKKRAEMICCLYSEDAKLPLGLKLLRNNIVPTLVAKADRSILEEYIELSKVKRTDSGSEKHTSSADSVKEMVMQSIPDIFTYLFGYTQREQTREGLQFVSKLCNVGVFVLCKQNLSQISFNLLLLLGHPESQVRKQTRVNIGKIVVAMDADLLREEPRHQIKCFWKEHILSVYHEFSGILNDKKSCRKHLVINSLTDSLKYISDEVYKYYPKIVSLLDLAIKSPNLRKACFDFWKRFITYVSHASTIKHLFGYIVAQAVKFYGECGDAPQKILKILIIDKKEITQECFADVAHIPLLMERKELMPIARELKGQSIGWIDQISRMSEQLTTVLPAFRAVLLEQILYLLNQNQAEFRRASPELTRVVNMLWESTVHETAQENMIMCARCMGLLIGFTEDARRDRQTCIPYDKKEEIMRHLITEYLVKILVDSSSIMYHDHSAYAIQEILKLLGCCEGNAPPSPRRGARSKANWTKFSSDVCDVIEPFRKSRYTVNLANLQSKIPEQKDVADVVNEDDLEWLHLFISKLFSISKRIEPAGDLAMFYACECALKDMPSLSRFILPYLVTFHVLNGNEDFLGVLRSEWQAVIRMLDDTNQRKRDFAKTATRLFFSMFDVLSSWNISPGSEKRTSSWRLLAIGSDLELSRAAQKCGLYHKALMHLEFHIRDEQAQTHSKNYQERMANEAAVVEGYQKELFELYQKLEDPDAVEFLKQNVADQQDYDETMAAKEVLEDTGQPSYKSVEYVNELLKLGRYERALSDSLQLRSERHDRNIDRLVMNAALRLGKWDDIRNLLQDIDPDDDETDPDYEMCVAKTLYGVSAKDANLCAHEIENARKALVGCFSEAVMLSYARMTPVLARFRILEELDTFTQKRSVSQYEWPQWHMHASLSIDEVEEVIATRFAMIDVSNERLQKKRLLEYELFLQLSKLCRKSDAFFRAEMFCARARKYGPDNEKSCVAACIYETAKIYNEKNKSTQALSLLAAAERMMSRCEQNEETKALIGKMLFSKGKWNDKWKSMDPKLIAKCYRNAANSLSLEDMGKAFMAIATLTDQRIFSLFHYLEQIKVDTAASAIRKTSSSMKFWASSSSPAVITKFLKKNLSLALNSYFESMVKAPKTAHEIIPRVLLLCFDIGKQFAEGEVKGQFELTLGTNQKDQVMQTIRESMKNAERVPAAVWMNSMTQLISRVEQPRKLEELLYSLIRIGVLNYPQATLWHLMSVKNSTLTERLTRFDPIWDFCKRDLPSERRNELDRLRDKFSQVTNDLIAFCSVKKESRAKEVKADTICPRIRESFRKSNLLLPVSSSLILKSDTPEFQDPTKYESATRTIKLMENEVMQFLSLQCPRRIAIVASDGKTYHYLCKEDEDLRKDMRTMEFASFVNLILSNDRRCRQRDLRLTTYAVVCLNEKCGIIEWVENTRCLRAIVEEIYKEKNIVVDRNDIKRYCGPDLKGDAAQNRANNFENIILAKYPPVMHLWFARRFTDLSQWFQARLIFTRSTAVWSIVGYFVGLGDRHAENVLLREDNGCCVHVDFNCIFDRAKTLQVPENVPFRMTQNIVDGMGVLKTNGTFARTCELVTETLRAKKQKLVSVLRPFLYDPLLEWKKGGNRTAIETTAKMTLKEIESRLEGFSEDRSTINSPECTVRNLIEQATDTRNLALLFHGWQAFI